MKEGEGEEGEGEGGERRGRGNRAITTCVEVALCLLLEYYNVIVAHSGYYCTLPLNYLDRKLGD